MVEKGESEICSKNDPLNETEENLHLKTNHSQNETENTDNPFKSQVKPPKRKKLKLAVETKPDNDNDTNEHGEMPIPVESKRHKKKLKQIAVQERNKDKEIEKAIAYMDKWNDNRDEWKYEKLRQIFIQKNVFDGNMISEEHSEKAIKYLATSKGAARANIIQRAESIIKEVEEKITDSNSDELTSSPQYKRAREILQSMQE